MDAIERISAAAPLVFLSVTVGLFVLLGVLAYQKKTAPAFAILLAAAICGSFSFLDHLSEISATASSLTIKVREASDALVGLRRLAALTGRTLITLEGQSGSIGGPTSAQLDQFKQQVLETLRSIGVDNATQKEVSSASKSRDTIDFVSSVTARVVNCIIPGDPRFVAFQQDVANSYPPTPENLRGILSKYDIRDNFVDKVLDEYTYYVRTGDHQDIPFWSARDSWPTGIFAAENGKPRCGK